MDRQKIIKLCEDMLHGEIPPTPFQVCYLLRRVIPMLKNDAELLAELEQVKAERQWIPVTERLPEVDKYGDVNVLVCMDDEFIASATYDKNNGWELWADSGEVTHWMPLPEAPIKEATDEQT